MAKVARQFDAIDAKAKKLTAEMSSFNELRIAEVKQMTVSLRDSVDQTILFMIGAAIVSGVAASRWLANNGIVGPILPLSSQTKQISDGDLETEIGGVGRVDEVDDMARALEAFREKGRARQSAEQQMAEERRNDETERRELERRVLEGEREVVSRREIPRASHA